MAGTSEMISNQNCRPRRKSVLKFLLKWGTSLGLVIWLLARTDFRWLQASLNDGNIEISRLAVGVLLCSFSVFLTLVRWQQLLTAFRFPVRFADVIRVGLFSYALNLLALGSAGGDLGRVILIGRKYPGQQKAAVLSVAVDRITGLYAMFFIVAVLVFTEKLFHSPHYAVRFIVIMTLFVVAILPGSVLAARIWTQNIRISSPGFQNTHVSKCLSLLSLCHGQSYNVGKALFVSLALRLSTAVGIYFLGTSLTTAAPDFRVHLVAISLAFLTGCLPLPFNGLGAMESMLEFAFQSFSETQCYPGYGVAVALLYRIFLAGVGILGVIVFCSDKRRSAALQPSPQW